MPSISWDRCVRDDADADAWPPRMTENHQRRRRSAAASWAAGSRRWPRPPGSRPSSATSARPCWPRAARRSSSRSSKLVEKGKLEPARARRALGRLPFTTELGALRDLRPRHRGGHRGPASSRTRSGASWTALCPPATIFASNTSSLTIGDDGRRPPRRPTASSASTSSTPCPLMPLVEVVRAVTTSAGDVRRGRWRSPGGWARSRSRPATGRGSS